MEQLNSKLYDKYRNLKKRKLVEEQELSHKRESALQTYQQEVEDLLEELRSENDRLRTEMADLQEKFAESQKLVLEESQKTKELSNEVGRLQNLLVQRKHDDVSPSPKSPYSSPKTRSRNTKKSPSEATPNSGSIQNSEQLKDAMIPYEIHQQKEHVPDCCRNNISSSGEKRSKCAFQTLLEVLFSMQFSLKLQDEGLRILATHQRSGYTFTLTWIRREDGDGEFIYRVSTLGTLERIALDWMKEEMIFSLTMCPVFFERVSRILGRS